ncbi:MAG: cation transporter, partial [Deltaproteobacteria bacterium]
LGAIRESKAPAIFIVFLEDTSAMMGLFIAFWGILLSNLLDSPLFDGVASVIIGALLAAVALLVSYETRSLLIGEGISREDLQKIRRAIASVPEVQEVMEILTMHLAPDDVLVNLNINFADGLTTDQVEEAIDKVERAVQQALPSVKRIFVEAESLKKAAPARGPSPTPPGE